MNATDFSTTPEAALAAWAAKNLPARLDAVGTARLLGFGEHDVQILMSAGLLKPLGAPAPNAPKWFASVSLIELAADPNWLSKATRAVAKHWSHKRARRRSNRPSPNANGRGLVEEPVQYVSASNPGHSLPSTELDATCE
jgi:hypothetical protein